MFKEIENGVHLFEILDTSTKQIAGGIICLGGGAFIIATGLALIYMGTH